MEDFKGKKVLIFGLGLNDGGLGMTEFFLEQGAIVTITDGKSKEELKPTLEKLEKYKDRITLHLGGHTESDFISNDIVVRNPAIKPNNKYLQIARDGGKRIEMEMSLFHRLAPCKIVGITGTKGKSTTSTLIYEFLKKKYGEKVLLGGNIGKSVIRELPRLTKDDIAVLELSSFQLDAMEENKQSPDIAVVTNIYEDHLDWHGNLDEYIEAKKNICKYQDKDGVLVVNLDNERASTSLDGYTHEGIRFSLQNSESEYYMDANLDIYEKGEKLLNIKHIPLQGTHNHYNILGAVAVARKLGVEVSDIMAVLKDFQGVEGRQQFVREIRGIKFYNDTTATSVEAMVAMLDRFKDQSGKIVMIAGGMDKGLEYSKVVEKMKKQLKALVLFEGTASEKIADLMNGQDYVHKYYGTLEGAVDKALELATSGDMVILCPGATSFNMFLNEFDRGAKYVNYVNSLK
ncbi:MAG: UDP-N-acetylmuramoyl-L-alanine--D-glutamate ligase [Candidatus Dojkabacteria bacterium]|jgi:UDP-N-acetylmuramoylalanine--D-glutamate ligase